MKARKIPAKISRDLVLYAKGSEMARIIAKGLVNMHKNGQIKLFLLGKSR